MAGDLNWKFENALDRLGEKRDAGIGRAQQRESNEDSFSGEFAKLKVSVIRPAFASVGNMLKERGHEFNISEDLGGKISIHIVPAGVNKSIHPYDWFPTLSYFPAPFRKTIGVQGRNMRRNSEASSGSRGDYTPAQINSELVESELLKFIGEIANW